MSEKVLCGKYDFAKMEDTDRYLQGIGVGLIFRKTISISTPRVELTFNDTTGEWTFKHDTAFHNYKITFKPDDPVAIDDETFDNRPCKTTAKWDKTRKDVLIFEQVAEEGDKVISLIEKLPDSSLKISRCCGSQRCSEYFKLASDIAGGDFSDPQAQAAGEAQPQVAEQGNVA